MPHLFNLFIIILSACFVIAITVVVGYHAWKKLLSCIIPGDRLRALKRVKGDSAWWHIQKLVWIFWIDATVDIGDVYVYKKFERAKEAQQFIEDHRKPFMVHTGLPKPVLNNSFVTKYDGEETELASKINYSTAVDFDGSKIKWWWDEWPKWVDEKPITTILVHLDKLSEADSKIMSELAVNWRYGVEISLPEPAIIK